MKFLRGEEGTLINAARIDTIFISERDGRTVTAAIYTNSYHNGAHVRLKTCTDRQAAQRWLDKLCDSLNGGNDEVQNLRA